jgi:serine/threonine protein kinase
MELSECKHIIRFYGTSSIEDRNVMVFEWAEHGTLKHLYEQKEIKWHYKVRIALNICRGLIFLQEADILHHDLRCQNILITESLEPKICSFELAHYSDGNASLSIYQATDGDVLPWLAPEMLTTLRYTTQCEIFSFGMLLWELTFEKIPYQGWEANKIKKYVVNGGREKFTFGDSTPKIYQEKCKTMINDSKYCIILFNES